MFNGVPDQFHQFIVSTTTAARTTTLPLSYPHLHNLSSSSSSSSNGFNSFDPLFTSNSHHHRVPTQLQQPQFLHPLQGQKNNEEKEEENIRSLVGMNMEIQRERSMAEPFDNHHHPWSNDEVLALLRIRSSMENWFPEFTWEYVSRKLAELGFNRDADKCKEKFEEESRNFNSIDCSKNNWIFNELEELCHGENPHPHHHQLQQHQSQQVAVAAEKNKNVENSREDEEDNMNQNLEDEHQTSAGNNGSDHQDNEKLPENYEADLNKIISSNKKRKKQMKVEILKGLCEDIVNKLMNQQEEMHNKLIEDMVKRDEERVAREEAWKKQELDMINQVLEVRTKEQAVVGDRQATIIKFMCKFSSTGSTSKQQCLRRINGDLVKVPNGYSNPPPTATSSSLVAAAKNPNPIVNNPTKTLILGSFPTQNNQIKPISMAENQTLQNRNPKTPTSSSALALDPQNPNSVHDESNPLSPTSPLTVNKAPQNPTSNDKEDVGKRWPRDEVLALINLRCSLYNNGDHHDHKDGAAAAMKAPLWERISQEMLQLGYKRSAKRCKEKWENINKYFRKTKDVNKKRSLDSRTCPYFHQLSSLYNQGTLIAPSEGPENLLALPENHSQTCMESSQRGDKHVSSTSF